MGTLKDLTGLKLGLLFVLDRAESRNGKTMWEVRCDCGTVKSVRAENILSGKVRSCGCASDRFRRTRLAKTFTLVNQRFGRLWVLWRVGSKRYGAKGSSHALWECRCDCGTVMKVTAKALRSGHTKSCGCLGSGN